MMRDVALAGKITACLTILLLLCASLLTISGGGVAATAAGSGYSDVPASHWAKSAIDQVSAKKYMSGYPDGSFHPNGTITRAEFTAVLVRLASIPAGSYTKFNDIQGHWANAAIQSAAAAGVVTAGDFGSSFKPNQPIKRLEMARMMARTLARTDGYNEYMLAFKGLYNGDLPFVDYRDIQKADLPYIGLVYGSMVMSGYPDASFGMGKNATRAEAAAMFVKLADSRVKKPESYQYLQELKEVAETGMNTTAVSDLIPMVNLVKDKPVIVEHANFTAKLKRLYVIPLDGKVSMYERKFVWDRNDPNLEDRFVKNRRGLVAAAVDVTYKKSGDVTLYSQYMFLNPGTPFSYQEPYNHFKFTFSYMKAIYIKGIQGKTDEVILYGYYNNDGFYVGLQTNYAMSGSYYDLLKNPDAGRK